MKLELDRCHGPNSKLWLVCGHLFVPKVWASCLLPKICFWRISEMPELEVPYWSCFPVVCNCKLLF